MISTMLRRSISCPIIINILRVSTLKSLYHDCLQSSFRQADGTAPSRKTFMNILAKLDAVLIRATQHSAMLSASLRDVTMDTSVAQRLGQEVAVMVEECTCPPGYSGLSCEVGN